MKNKIFLKVIIPVITLALFMICVLYPKTKVSAEIFNCVVQKDVDIPFDYQFLKMNILANTEFEIKLNVEEASEGENLVIKFVASKEAGDFEVDGKTLYYYLGDDVYSLTKLDYEILGPEGDADTDIEIPPIYALFMRAKLEDKQDDWDGYAWDQYLWDTGAKITNITIATNAARIKYIEFLNDTGDAHEDSDDFGDYDNFEETDWENLTLTTGEPIISTSEDTLYLTIPQTVYPYTAYPYTSYGLGYTSFGYPYISFQGRYPAGSPWSYPGSYSNIYSSHFPSGWNLNTYLNLTSSNRYPYSTSYSTYNSPYNPLMAFSPNPFGYYGSSTFPGGYYGSSTFPSGYSAPRTYPGNYFGTITYPGGYFGRSIFSGSSYFGTGTYPGSYLSGLFNRFSVPYPGGFTGRWNPLGFLF